MEVVSALQDISMTFLLSVKSVTVIALNVVLRVGSAQFVEMGLESMHKIKNNAYNAEKIAKYVTILNALYVGAVHSNCLGRYVSTSALQDFLMSKEFVPCVAPIVPPVLQLQIVWFAWKGTFCSRRI